MERVDQIKNHPSYIEAYKRITKLEADRRYCKHDMEHFLNVARIAYILTLEQNLYRTNLCRKKEVIYGIALLHDIGKHLQYEENIPHEIASADLGREILREIDFKEEEKELIISCILSHRKKSDESQSLQSIIYLADKWSRPCYSCEMSESCSWTEEKKNKGIII